MSFPKFSTWKVVSHREKAAIYIPSGKRFPIETSIFLWFSYGFPMVFPLKPPFSYGFPMVFPLKPPFSYGFPMVFPLKPPFFAPWGSRGHGRPASGATEEYVKAEPPEPEATAPTEATEAPSTAESPESPEQVQRRSCEWINSDI